MHSPVASYSQQQSHLPTPTMPTPPPSPGPQCPDQPPGGGAGANLTCAQQKAFGKCSAAWMRGHCCKTCFECKNCNGMSSRTVKTAAVHNVLYAYAPALHGIGVGSEWDDAYVSRYPGNDRVDVVCWDQVVIIRNQVDEHAG